MVCESTIFAEFTMIVELVKLANLWVSFQAAFSFTITFLAIFIYVWISAVGEVLAEPILVELLDGINIGHFGKLFLK